jgi:predicted RNA-binding Zn-ribbon protein involved in translation (DUF1610 family)
MIYLSPSINWSERKLKTAAKEKQMRIALCPSCNKPVVCEGEPDKKFLIKCPFCGKRGIILFTKKYKKLKHIEIKEIELDHEKNKKDSKRQRRYFSMNQLYRIIQIIGILLLIIGIVLLIKPPYLTLKPSVPLIFIGYLLILMISETRKRKEINSGQLMRKSILLTNPELFMPEIISLSIIIWTLFLFFITPETDFGVFFVCMFLGMLAAKELTDRFTTTHFKKRMNVFIFVFLIGTVLIITQKIITL